MLVFQRLESYCAISSDYSVKPRYPIRRIEFSLPSSIRWAVVLLSLWIALLACIPLWSVLQIGADEGFELAKATEILHGHKLYTDVWNDQPPLHTFLVSKILKDFSKSILWPRLITVASATIFLTAVFLLILRLNGLFAAVAASGFLIGSPGFFELSSSCMLEIPALASALAAVCLLAIAPMTKRPIKEILVGVLFGIALQVKLIVVILLPIAALIVWLRSCTNEQLGTKTHFWNTARSLSLITVSAGVTFVALDWAIDRGAFLRNFQQSWSSHFGSAKSFEYGSAREYPFDWSILLKHWDTTVPALLGIYFLCRSNEGRLALVSLIPYSPVPRTSESAASRVSTVAAHNRRFSIARARQTAAIQSKLHPTLGPLIIIPVVWLFLELLVFATHIPWWPYYYVHIAVPLCWLAGIGISTVAQLSKPAVKFTPFQRPRRFRRAPQHSIVQRVVLSSVAFCAFTWLSTRLYLQISDIRNLPRISSTLVLQDIARFKPFAHFLYADESIYSFYAGIPMPPNLAVAPLKRFWAGDMTNARLAAELYATKPEVMLLKNDTRERPFSELIATEYQLVYEDGRHRLFVRRDIAKRVRYIP